jgi:SAM-dependent methyltransferase
VRVAVTTPLRPSAGEESAAREAAARHGLPLAPRRNLSAARTAERAEAEALLVLSATRSVLWLGGESHVWSAGMGVLRAKRAGREVGPTGRDPFLEAAAFRAGETVLDATLGLGADALVAAAAVGPDGRVLGIEASPALAAWVAEGLRRLDLAPARRIEVRAGDHVAVLASLPDRSFDAVAFDPMFRHARAAPGGFGLLRRLADPRPLSREALDRACRVARRRVVVKDGAPGWDLARLGLRPLASARGAHRYYGVVDVR